MDFQFSCPLRDLPSVTPFVAPEALERQAGRPLRLRLGANESLFGISPKARAAMREAAEAGYLYGDPESFELRNALAAHHGVTGAEISVGSGIDDLLGLIARAFVEPGRNVVTSLGGYPTFNYHVEGFGGTLHRVPYRSDFRNDLEGLAALAHEVRPHLVYLANPDNPTGTWYSPAELAAFRAALPEDAVLVLDEAYVDFAPQSTDGTAIGFDPRVIRLRTFSKAHGLAGLRIGYMLAHKDIVAAFDKIRHHFGVNRVAQAGALASLSDAEFLRSVVSAVSAGRSDYTRLGLPCVPSATNFVCFDFGTRDEAEGVMAALLGQGVFVRKPMAAPLDRLVRITVGPPQERTELSQILANLKF